MPKIVYKTKKAVAIIKPVGMPSQSDPSGDRDAMTATSEMLFAAGERETLFLVHRLDRTVGGVMVFARSKESAAALSSAIGSGNFKKEYLAVVEGRLEDGELRDYLFKDSRLSKAFVVSSSRRGAKLASLSFKTLETVNVAGGERSLVRIELHTGRFHQIRAQFSSRGASLVGDGKYGSRDKGARFPALFATSVSCEGILDKEVSALPDSSLYPWSLFDFFK